MRNFNIDSYINRTKMVNAIHTFLNNVQPQFNQVFKDGVKVKQNDELIKKQNDAIYQIINDEKAKCKDMMLSAHIRHYGTLHYLFVQIGYNTHNGTEYIKKQVYLYRTEINFKYEKEEPRFIMKAGYQIAQPRTIVAKVKEIRARNEKIRDLQAKNRDLCYSFDTFINSDEVKYRG
tara:strand:- start:177 stop:704 length:528 start_codon:yes stop_codon:yes gene_type:complete